MRKSIVVGGLLLLMVASLTSCSTQASVDALVEKKVQEYIEAHREELKGDKGDTGMQGIQGVAGKDGKDGEDGLDGRDGINGIKGKDGKDGRNGLHGVDGKDGKDGIDGRDGKDGRDGVDGKDGLTPYIGANGNWWIGEEDTGTIAKAQIDVVNQYYTWTDSVITIDSQSYFKLNEKYSNVLDFSECYFYSPTYHDTDGYSILGNLKLNKNVRNITKIKYELYLYEYDHSGNPSYLIPVQAGIGSSLAANGVTYANLITSEDIVKNSDLFEIQDSKLFYISDSYDLGLLLYKFNGRDNGQGKDTYFKSITIYCEEYKLIQ